MLCQQKELGYTKTRGRAWAGVLRKGEKVAGEEWWGVVRSFVPSRHPLEPDTQEQGEGPGQLWSHS